MAIGRDLIDEEVGVSLLDCADESRRIRTDVGADTDSGLLLALRHDDGCRFCLSARSSQLQGMEELFFPLNQPLSSRYKCKVSDEMLQCVFLRICGRWT